MVASCNQPLPALPACLPPTCTDFSCASFRVARGTCTLPRQSGKRSGACGRTTAGTASWSSENNRPSLKRRSTSGSASSDAAGSSVVVAWAAAAAGAPTPAPGSSCRARRCAHPVTALLNSGSVPVSLGASRGMPVGQGSRQAQGREVRQAGSRRWPCRKQATEWAGRQTGGRLPAHDCSPGSSSFSSDSSYSSS